MDTSNITEIINTAVAAATKNDGDIGREPVFWLLMFIIGFTICAITCGAVARCGYSVEIDNALKRQNKEVREWLLNEKERITGYVPREILEARKAEEAREAEEVREQVREAEKVRRAEARGRTISRVDSEETAVEK